MRRGSGYVADPAKPFGWVGVSIQKLSAAHQHLRADRVGETPPRETAVCFGLSGQSPVYKLNYVDANNVWVFPSSHTALLGPLKDLWKLLLDSWTQESEICECVSW